MFKQTKTNFRFAVVPKVSRALKFVLFLVALTGVFLYTRVGAPARVEAATSSELNFQARLLTSQGGIVADGTYNVEFKLYDASSSSGSSQGSCTGDAHCLWTETYTSGNKVTVKAGYLSVHLGSLTSFPSTINWDQNLYLTMNIGGTGSPTWDGEMTPRLKLTAVPFAFAAGKLAQNSGANSGQLSFSGITNNPDIKLPDISGTNNVLLQSGTTLFTQGSIPFTDANGRLTQDNGNLFYDGTNHRLGVGTASPNTVLDVNGAISVRGISAPSVSPSGQGRIYFDSTANLFKVSQDGSNYYDLCTTVGNCSGTGSSVTTSGGVANRIPVYTAAQDLTSSYLLQSASGLTLDAGKNLTIDTDSLFVDGTNHKVGVGTTSPSGKLDVVLSSTNTTAGTEKGINLTVTDTGVVTSGTDTTYGQQIAVTRTGATGGTINTTGLDISVTGDTGGTSTATGLKVAVSSADTNYAATFTGGNVGIGTTAPSAALSVGSSSQFQVNSSGAVAAATGITSSGTITFSGLNSVGVVTTNGSGVLATGVLDRNSSNYFNTTLSVGNGGTGATTLAANGILFGNGTSAIQATSAAANSVLVTNGSNVPSLSQTLPTAVQGNITSTGALNAGSITSGFGSIDTGSDNISTTGTVNAGTLSVTNNATVGGTLGVTGTSSLVGALTLGNDAASPTRGQLILHDNTGSNSFTGTLVVDNLASTSTTYTLPDVGNASATICVTYGSGSGNCTGAVTSTGSANRIPVFTTDGNHLGDSYFLQAAGSVTLDANKDFIFASGSGAFDQSASSGTFKTGTGAVSLNGDVGIASGKNFLQNGTGTFGTGSGAVSLNGDTTVTGTKTLTVSGGLTTLSGGLTVTGTTSINTTGTASTSIGNATGTIAITSNHFNVDTAGAITGVTGYAQASGNFLQSGSGTFGTGTGAVSLNGDTTIAAGKNLSLASGAGTFTQAYTGTGDAFAITANSLTTGTGLKVTTSNNTAADTAWNGLQFNLTNAQGTTAVSTGSIFGVDYEFTQNTSVAGNTESVANFAVKKNDSSTTDSAVSSIINLANNDTATGNQITVTDGLKINGSNITNGINLSGTFGSNLITSSNFSVTQAGAITGVGVNSGTGLIQGTGGLTVQGTTQINTSGTANTTIGNSAGGTITIGATSGSDLVLQDAQWGVTGAGAATFTSVDAGSGTIQTTGATNTGTLGVSSTSTFTGLATFNGGVSVANNSNFSQTGSGTFGTGSGAVSLNGNTSITGSKTFSVGSGATTLGGTLDVTGTATFSSTINANGGTLATNQSSFNLLNTTASTINAFGGASTINLGADGVDIVGAGAVTLEAGGTNKGLTLNPSGTGTLTLGNTGTANTIQIGNTTGAVNETINIGNNATGSSQTNVTIGSTIGASTTTLQAGSGGVVLGASKITRTASGSTNINLVDGADTTLSLTNSGAGNANLTVDGSGTFGTGLTVTSGGATITAGDLAISAGNLTTGGTQRLSNAGALSNITGYSQSSGNFSQSGGGTFGTGTGAVSLNGDTTIASGKSLTVTSGRTNLTGPSGSYTLAVNASGAGGTGLGILSSGATGGDELQLFDVNGNNPVAGFDNSGQLYVGRNSQLTGAIKFFGATNTLASGHYVTLQGPNVSSGSNTLTLPDETGTLCSTGSVCSGYQAAAASGSYLQQVPTSTATNTVTPTTNSVVGLTVNATSGTAATALIVNQSQGADGLVVNATNTSGTETNGLLINRNGAGGTTTNLLNLTNTAGTATNALNISGTFTNLINAPNLVVTNAGNADFAGTLTAGTANAFQVSASGAVTAVGVDAGTGLLQGTGGFTLTGTTLINTTGTANTSIGNSTGTLALTSNHFNVDTAGAITGVTGYAQASGNFLQSGSGTFGTGSGAVSLNGDTTIAAGKNFSLASGTGAFSQTFTGTGDAHTITANSLTTGTALKVTSSNNTAANTAWNGLQFNLTNAQGTTAVSSGSIYGADFEFTQNTSVAGNTEAVANFAIKQNDSSSTDSTVSSIINIANNDTATGNQITATDGIKISGSNITNGINLSGTFGTNLITSSNFTVTQAGAITGVGVNSGTGLLQGTGGLSLTGTTQINTSGTANTTIGNSAGGTITIGAASGSDLVLQDAEWGVTGAGAATFTSVNAGSGTIQTTGLTSTGTLSVSSTSTFTGLATFNGGVSVANNSNFSQTGSGTFGTGSGAVSLNGNTSVTGSKTFSVGSGATTLGGTLDVTGTATFSGTINANGGTLATNQSSFNLLNTTASTINAFGGASTINLGADGVDIVGAGALTLEAGGTNKGLTLNPSGTGTLTLGNTGTGNTIQIGNTSGAVSETINIGNNATGSSQTNVTIGSTIGASTTTLQAGSGGVVLGASKITRTASGTTTINLVDGSDTTLAVTNTGAGNANITADGNITANGDLQGTIVNATTGFRVNGAATSGNYLRGNGTNFVSSSLNASDLQGTIFNTSADSGSGTIVYNDTLAIQGGTNGIDTSLSGDTFTLNLDTTEISSTTFGSGSGFTWTFDAGSTDPTIAFANDAITVTAATTTFSGDLRVNGNDIADSGGTNRITLGSTTTLTNTTTTLSGTTTLTASSLTTFNTAATLALSGDLQVNGNDIKDSGATTRLSLGSTNAITGNLTVSGTTDLSNTLSVDKTVSADAGGTTNVTNITLTTPADTSGTNVHQGLNLAPTIGNATGGTNTTNVINIANVTGDDEVSLNAIKIGNLTGSAASEYALNIGSGWDAAVRVNGNDVINGSGQVIASRLTGTLFSVSSDSGGPSAVAQGNTVTVQGSTNGIDVTQAGNTLTVALDTTEIGTTTFGSGSAFTWTFDASSGTDTSIAFGNNTISLTSGTTTLSGNLAAQGSSASVGASGVQGSLVLYDGGTTGGGTINTATLKVISSLAQDTTITFPDPGGASGTVCYQNDTNCGFASSAGSGNYIQNGTTVQTNANIAIQSNANGSITEVLKQKSGQTADLLQFQDSSNNPLAGITQDGRLYYKNSGFTQLLDVNNLSSDHVITLPDRGGEICTTSGNCVGTGGSGDILNGGNDNTTVTIGTNQATYDLFFETANTNRIHVTDSGEVGIGTTGTPAALLSVGGTTGNLTVTSGGLLTTIGGADISGATTSINASSNFATNINTGSSTGTVNIGNSIAGALTIQSGSTIAITTTNLNVSTAGVVTLAGAQTADITTTAAASANGITIQPGGTTAANGTGATLSLKGGDESSTSCGTACIGGNISIQGGSATGGSGTTRNGGNVSIDAGTGATANGTISLGITNAASISIGHSGVTTTNNGGLTVTQAFTANSTSALNGDVTIAANKNLTLSSGTGVLTQTFNSAAAASAQVVSLTNSNTGAGVSVQGTNFTPTNTSTPSSGTNTLNVVNFAAGGAISGTDQVTNGINFASTTGYSSFINTPSFVLNSAGAISGVTGFTQASGNFLQNGSGTFTTGSGAVTLNGDTTLASGKTLTLTSFNTGDTSDLVCRNSSGQLATCNSSLSGAAFVQGGNSFSGTTAGDLGTNNNGALNLRTNGTTKLTVSTSGDLTFAQASTISTSTGNLTVQANGTSTLTLGTTGAGTVNLGATNAATVVIGNTANTTTLTLDAAASSTVSLANGAQTHTINIGSGAAAQTITLGSTDTTSSTTIQGGSSGAINLGSVSSSTLASTIHIADTSNATGTQTVTIGSNAKAANALTLQGGSTGGINIGSGSLTNIGSIGSATTSSTVHIADTTNGTGLQSVSIGSNANGNNTLTLEAGVTPIGPASTTGNIAIGNAATAHSIFIGTSSSADQIVSLGSDSSGSLTVIEGTLLDIGALAANHNIGIGTDNTTTQLVAIGSSSASSTTSIQGGTGASAVDIESAGSGTISLGASAVANTVQIGTTLTNTGNTQTIGVGNLNAAGTTNVTIGTGSSATAGTTTLQSKGTLTVGNAISPTINIRSGASGTINLGDNAVANTIQIGINGTNTGNTQTINIGNQASAGTTNVVLGAFTGATAGNTTLQAFGTLALQTAASGSINIGTNTVTGKTISIGSTGSTNNDTTIHIGDSSAAVQTITLGGTGSSSTTTVQAATGGVTVQTAASSGSNNTGSITIQTGAESTGTTNSSGSITLQTGNATNNNNSSGGISLDVGSKNGSGTTGSITIGTGSNAPTAITISKTGGATTNINGSLTLGASAGSGTLLTNNGATLNAALAISDDNNGGALGGGLTAAQSVDIYTAFNVNQTTAGQTVTLPTPTSSTAGRIIFVSNVGSASFTVTYGTGGTSSVVIAPSNTAQFFWNGSVWTSAGVDGSGANFIQNQNSVQQTANFYISGTGRLETGLQSPNLERATSGTLSVGTTSNTTSLTLGSSNATGNVILDSGASSTLTIGSAVVARTINIGNVAAAETVTLGSTNTTSTTNINAGSGKINLTGDVTIATGNSLTFTGGASNFDQHLSSGTFQSGTGAVSLNGDTTVATGKNLTVTAGSTSLTGAAAGSSTAVTIATGAASNKGLVVQGASSQSGDLAQIQDSTGANLIQVSAGGNINTTGNYTNSVAGLGQYSNLLTKSEQLDDTGSWTASANMTVTPNDGASNPAPDGQTTAEKLVSSSTNVTLTQTFTTSTNGNYTFSVWVKTNSGTGTVNLRIDSTGATPTTGTAASFTATTTWQRIMVTQNFTGTPSNIKAVILLPNNSTTVVAWGAQLVTGTSAQVYARTVGSNISTSVYGIVNRGNTLIQPAADGTSVFQIQLASNAALFTADTTNKVIKLGTGTASLTYSGSGNLYVTNTAEIAGRLFVGADTTNNIDTNSGHLLFNGTFRNSKTLNFSPEFQGAVLTGDGSSNVGTMSSDFCGNDGAGSFADIATGVCATSGDFHNYYSWTANATNDYDIWVKWKVPKDFSAFDTTPLQFYGWRTSSSDSVTLTLYNASGAVCGTATSISGTVAQWNLTTYTSSGCSPSAGDDMFFDVHLSVGVNGEFARIGEIFVNYLSKF